jgi:hypothetical protein
MNDQNHENLKDLFERFFKPEQAEEAANDVHKADQIFREHPAPEPSNKLILGIKAEIAEALSCRKARLLRRSLYYKTAAVAAAVIVLAAISIRLFEKETTESKSPATTASMTPKTIWEDDTVTTYGGTSAIIAAEIEEIEGEILALQLGENSGNGHMNTAELETKLTEINSDFWKG